MPGIPWQCWGCRGSFGGSGDGTDALTHGRGPGCAINAVAPPGIPQPYQGPGDRAGDPIAMPGMLWLFWGSGHGADSVFHGRDPTAMPGIPYPCWGSRGHAEDAVMPRETPTLALFPCRRAQHRRSRLPGTTALGGGDGGGAGLQRQRQPPAPRRLRQAGGPPRPPGQPQRHPRPRRHLPVPSHQRARLGSPQHHHHR